MCIRDRRNIARGLEINREELFKEIETQIDQQSKANLTLMTSTPEFKQQLVQSVRSGLQPVIETIVREAAERMVAQAGSGGSDSRLASRVSLAMTLGVIALLGSAAALLGYVFKLF